MPGLAHCVFSGRLQQRFSSLRRFLLLGLLPLFEQPVTDRRREEVRVQRGGVLYKERERVVWFFAVKVDDEKCAAAVAAPESTLLLLHTVPYEYRWRVSVRRSMTAYTASK